MISSKNIRPPAVAGMFYSNNSTILSENINAFFDEALSPQISGNILALISPHAGYMYSGDITGDRERVVGYMSAIVLRA